MLPTEHIRVAGLAVQEAEAALRDPATADPTPAELTQVAIAHALIAIANKP